MNTPSGSTIYSRAAESVKIKTQNLLRSPGVSVVTIDLDLWSLLPFLITF